MKTCLVIATERSKFSPLLFAGKVDSGIKAASQLGYDGIEINIRDSAKIDQEHIIKTLKSHKLKLVSIGTGQAYYDDGISLASADPRIREKVINRLKDHICFAGKVQAQVVLGSIRGTFAKDDLKRKLEFEGALEAVKICADFAHKHGVILTIEPINSADTSFINTVSQGLEFIECLNKKGVMLLADTYQFDLQKENIPRSLKLAGKRLAHVHLVDSGRHVPGKGNIDLLSALKALKELNYKGYLSAEVLPIPDDSSAAKEYVNNLRKLFLKL